MTGLEWLILHHSYKTFSMKNVDNMKTNWNADKENGEVERMKMQWIHYTLKIKQIPVEVFQMLGCVLYWWYSQTQEQCIWS